MKWPTPLQVASLKAPIRGGLAIWVGHGQPYAFIDVSRHVAIMAMLFAPAYMGGDLRRQIKKWPSPFPGNRLARLATMATPNNGRARVTSLMPRKDQRP